MRTKYAAQTANLPEANAVCDRGHPMYRSRSVRCDRHGIHRHFRCPMRVGAGPCTSDPVIVPPRSKECEERG